MEGKSGDRLFQFPADQTRDYLVEHPTTELGEIRCTALARFLAKLCSLVISINYLPEDSLLQVVPRMQTSARDHSRRHHSPHNDSST